jgi:hypothetical protein
MSTVIEFSVSPLSCASVETLVKPERAPAVPFLGNSLTEAIDDGDAMKTSCLGYRT